MLKRPKTGQQICRDCFFYVFETEVHNTITHTNLFKPGERVAIGASGGKGTLTWIPLLRFREVNLILLLNPGFCLNRLNSPGIRHENTE